jgi:hypothetical protein
VLSGCSAATFFDGSFNLYFCRFGRHS